MSTIDLAREGFRAAPTENERVLEAVKLFKEGKAAQNFTARARLLEAFTTSDFTALLAKGFTLQALAIAQNITNEFEPVLFDTKVNDFNDHKLVDLWSGDAFEEVKEGEEYKAGTLQYIEKLLHRAKKHGRTYGLTFELRINGLFSQLADFPRYLANGSVRGQKNAVTGLLLTQAGAWQSNFFQEVENVALSRESLLAAVKKVRERKNHRGDRVGGDQLVLVYGDGLVDTVDALLNPTTEEVRRPGTNNETIVTTQANPLNGKIAHRLQSDTLADRLGNQNAWALLKSNTSDLPSLIRTQVEGLEGLDIRVKKDQGQYVGGGEVPVDQGSFNDDTAWFRGRDIWGIDPGFKEGTYASNGG